MAHFPHTVLPSLPEWCSKWDSRMIQLKNNPPRKKKPVLALQAGSLHSTAELTLLRRWQIASQKWQLQLPAVWQDRATSPVTAPSVPLAEVLPLHLQHREVFYSVPHAQWAITNLLLSGSLHKPRLWLGGILNEIGFAPAHRTAVRFTGSAIQAKAAFSLTSVLKTSGLKWRLIQHEARAGGEWKTAAPGQEFSKHPAGKELPDVSHGQTQTTPVLQQATQESYIKPFMLGVVQVQNQGLIPGDNYLLQEQVPPLWFHCRAQSWQELHPRPFLSRAGCCH